MFVIATSVWYNFARACGAVLRNTRYSTVDHIAPNATHIRKKRLFYAPVLIRLGNWLMQTLNMGVQVLPDAKWQARECFMYRELYSADVSVESTGAILLPKLQGVMLTSYLGRGDLPLPNRIRAVAVAAVALEEFHARNLSHGDAMAANALTVMSANRTYWIDFETEHSAALCANKRRSDDLRAFVSTVALCFARSDLPAVINAIDQSYEDAAVKRLTAEYFSTVWHRALIFHLGQAPLSHGTFVEIGRLMKARL